MKLAEFADAELWSLTRGATSISRDADTGEQWIWAGYADKETLGDGTAVCNELERRGLLGPREQEDGFWVWPIPPFIRDCQRL